MNLLLVDDEEEFTSTLAERLAMRGVDADCAASGSQALQMVKQKKYDLVVLDMKMAGLSGLQTIEKILQDFPSLKFIILTGHAGEEDYHKGTAAGAAFYLMKPFDIDLLMEKINQALGR